MLIKSSAAFRALLCDLDGRSCCSDTGNDNGNFGYNSKIHKITLFNVTFDYDFNTLLVKCF